MDRVFCFGLAAWIAYTYGSVTGYRYWGAHDPFQAAFYGGGTLFVVAALGLKLLVWPVVRGMGNNLFGNVASLQLAARRNASTQPAIPAAELDAAIARGMVFSYQGLVDRDYHYRIERDHRERIRATFQVQRNTAAMSPRERTAICIFETLRAEQLLSGSVEDDLRFALAWGDGRCELTGSGFKATNLVKAANNLANFRALIVAEAGHRDASTEGAISQLHTALQVAAGRPNAPPRVIKLLQRFTAAAHGEAGATQWT